MTDSGYAVYQWLSPPGFLVHALAPGAATIDATPDDDPVRVVAGLPGAPSVFHFHLNCTRTARFPFRRGELVAMLHDRSVRTINAAVTDISKRVVQHTCAEAGINTTAASRDGALDELLIVKTDLNFGGDSEWALSDADRDRLAAGAGSSVMWKPHDYRVLARRNIEAAWWDDATLVFERFIENRDHRWYRIFLLFSQMVVCELIDPELIKKVGHSKVSRTWMVTLPDAGAAIADEGIRRIARDVERFAGAFTLDFGAVDVVVSDGGEPYIIDVNVTPAYNYPIDGLVEHLRSALPADVF